MPNQGAFFIHEFHGDHIEAAGRLDPFRVFGQESEGDFSNPAAFDRGDRFLGKAAFGVRPGFDFEENQRRAVPGDDVDFPAAETVAAGDEAVVFPEKMANGGVFAAAA